MIFSKSKTKGFTLIELLVVIAIIGLLSSVVLASLNSARAKGRNSSRLQAIYQLRTAFNLAFNSNNSFPTGGWYCISSTNPCLGGWNVYSHNATVDAFLALGMSSQPSDPVGGSMGFGGYLYANPAGPYTLYDGSTLSAGAMLMWVVEPPMTTTSCGPGKIYVVTANYVQCMLKLD
jgi:prepilin-type N-terminal cleavage/methylation domain-containing protein